MTFMQTMLLQAVWRLLKALTQGPGRKPRPEGMAAGPQGPEKKRRLGPEKGDDVDVGERREMRGAAVVCHKHLRQAIGGPTSSRIVVRPAMQKQRGELTSRASFSTSGASSGGPVKPTQEPANLARILRASST